MSKRREQIERQKAQQRKQTMVILVVIAALAIILIGGAVALNSSKSQPQALVAVNEPPPQNAEKNGRAWGPVEAPITIVDFVDSQCPACGQYVTKVEPSVIEAFAKTGKVRYEVRMLTFVGQESVNAAKAALCAMDQDQFWQMHATIFANQTRGENAGDFTTENLQLMAAQLGMDKAVFNQCLGSGKYDAVISQDRDEASRLGVTQTPTTLINGRKYTGAQGVNDLKRIFADLAPDVKFSQ